MILCSHFSSHTTIDKDQSSVSNRHCCDCCTAEVITAWAVDDVELLSIPFCMEYRAEYRVAIFLLYWEVVGNSVVHCDTATTCNLTRVINQGFSKCGLTSLVITKECNVLDLF